MTKSDFYNTDQCKESDIVQVYKVSPLSRIRVFRVKNTVKVIIFTSRYFAFCDFVLELPYWGLQIKVFFLCEWVIFAVRC